MGNGTTDGGGDLRFGRPGSGEKRAASGPAVMLLAALATIGPAATLPFALAFMTSRLQGKPMK